MVVTAIPSYQYTCLYAYIVHKPYEYTGFLIFN